MTEKPAAATDNREGQPWVVYQCVHCRSGPIDGRGVIDGTGTARCTSCAAEYSVAHHIIDTLIDPAPAVVEELRGLARERGRPPDEWEDVKLETVEHVSTIDELADISVDEPVQYYQQTIRTFDQALTMASPHPGDRVLEVGPNPPYWFLRRLAGLAEECFALNIIFFWEEPDAFLTWPNKALGDMNNLPYQDATFDFVLLSATAHHSSDLRSLFSEIRRVLVPGGRALVLNEPVEGLLKRFGGGQAHGRDEHIHEGQFRVWEYASAIRDAGLEHHSFLSDFFDEKLRSGRLHPDTRFRWLGLIVSRCWSSEIFRRVAKRLMLWPAQATVGLPFNAVVSRPAGEPDSSGGRSSQPRSNHGRNATA